MGWVRRAACVGLAVALFATAGCQSNRDTAVLTGMAAGAAAGAAAGSKSNRGAAVVIGAIIGGVVGLIVGVQLDEADKRKAEAAAQRAAAAPAGERINWYSDKNPQVSGYAEPVSPTESAGAPDQDTKAQPVSGTETKSGDAMTEKPQDVAAPQRNCRTVREVAVIHGKEIKEDVRYCLSDSGWVRA